MQAKEYISLQKPTSPLVSVSDFNQLLYDKYVSHGGIQPVTFLAICQYLKVYDPLECLVAHDQNPPTFSSDLSMRRLAIMVEYRLLFSWQSTKFIKKNVAL